MRLDLLQKAKAAKSPEELLALARAEGMELTEEKAEELFQKFIPPAGELSDDELSNVAGGGCGGDSAPALDFKEGDKVTVITPYAYGGNTLMRCNSPFNYVYWDTTPPCIDPDCQCSLFTVRGHINSSGPSNPNDPAAKYVVICSQCGQKFRTLKQYLYHT